MEKLIGKLRDERAHLYIKRNGANGLWGLYKRRTSASGPDSDVLYFNGFWGTKLAAWQGAIRIWETVR